MDKGHSIAECEKAIKRFGKKYGMSLDEFYKKLGSKFKLSWDHKKDYLERDWTTAQLEDYRAKLRELEAHGSK